MRGAGPRRWGYHRLSEEWARRVVDSAGIELRELVLDLGAGTGALTFPLAATGARVIAVELHAGRARTLRATAPGNVKVVQTDAACMALPRRPYRVVSNPPFAASASIVRSLTRRGSHLYSADLVLPWYVTARWIEADIGGWDFAPGLRLPRWAFIPHATCDTRVLRIRRRGTVRRSGTR